MEHSVHVARRLDVPSPLTTSFVAAAVLPSLLAFNLPPSPTFFNQAIAFALWGWVVAHLSIVGAARSPLRKQTLLPLCGALVLCLVSLTWTWVAGPLPQGLALSGAATLLAACLLGISGSASATSNDTEGVLRSFFIAWLVAGLASAIIGLLQVFAPAWTDGDWIARTGLAGRSVGNLRQPNHLSSLLLWAAVALIPLLHDGRIKRPIVVGLFGLLIFVVELTGSRTGMVGTGVLALWGALDRRLARAPRALLLSAPVWYGLFWLLMSQGTQAFGAAAHVTGGDLSSSRFAIWSDTLALIAQHPWTGVGFGEFNFAWSLTPFPDRPVAFFDHTHNLPLQLAVELGLPITTGVLALLGWALWRAWRNSSVNPACRAAFMMVLMMALHSQLEYPLWYAYFLLPTAWAWGYCLGSGPTGKTESAPRSKRWLVPAGLAMVMASAISVVDYWRVAQIFAPEDNAPSLEERIATGRRSLLFAHHADYAYVTTSDEPVTEPHAFDRAPHYLLDTRLMIAWASSYAARGDLDRARHIAQRLREFRNSASDEFFAPCTAPAPRTFQCEPPSRTLTWQDFK